jgi:DNA-directed RNA polymerase subunit H (RpoH/RPB5)
MSSSSSSARRDIAPNRIYKSRDEIRQTCLQTLIEYIDERGKIMGDVTELAKQAWKSGTDDSVYKIPVVTERLLGNETSSEEVVRKTRGKTWLVKFIDEPVTATTGNTALINFMTQNEGIHKIIVMPHFGRKVYAQLMNYGDVEVFFETDLLSNIFKDDLEPKFEILSTTEARRVMREYVIQQGKFPPMYENDQVAVALALRPGTLLRVIVPNEGSGLMANYRMVVKTVMGRV